MEDRRADIPPLLNDKLVFSDWIYLQEVWQQILKVCLKPQCLIDFNGTVWSENMTEDTRDITQAVLLYAIPICVC